MLSRKGYILNLNQTLLIAAAACLLLPAAASATTYTVSATDAIFAAGLSSPPAFPSGNGNGTLPLQINVTGGAYQFQYLSGTVTPNDTRNQYSLDANGQAGQFTDISSYGSISSYYADNGFALVGVFLGASGQSGPAPSAIDFTTSGTGVNFTSLAPQIGQIFFIGDGTNSLGQAQTFYVPTGATELYLGFADGPNFDGAPGQYGDNSGTLSMSVVTVPEPAPVALMLASSALIAVLRFRNKR